MVIFEFAEKTPGFINEKEFKKTSSKKPTNLFAGCKRDFIMLSLLSFVRLAKKVGIKRISKDALEEIRDAVTEEGLEIAEKAFKISRHANRKTVMLGDVKFVVRHEKK